MMGGKAWTAEEMTRLKFLAGGRTTADTIAERMGRTVPSVEQAARAAGIALKRRERIEIPWTKEEIDRGMQMRKSGMGWGEIGRELGRSYAAVASKLREHERRIPTGPLDNDPATNERLIAKLYKGQRYENITKKEAFCVRNGYARAG